jgi:hypothetical protein
MATITLVLSATNPSSVLSEILLHRDVAIFMERAKIGKNLPIIARSVILTKLEGCG